MVAVLPLLPRQARATGSIADRTGWHAAAHRRTVMRFSWYLDRLRRMSLAEIGWRTRNVAMQNAWRGRTGDAWRVPPWQANADIRRPLEEYPVPCPEKVAALLAAAETSSPGDGRFRGSMRSFRS